MIQKVIELFCTAFGSEMGIIHLFLTLFFLTFLFVSSIRDFTEQITFNFSMRKLKKLQKQVIERSCIYSKNDPKRGCCNRCMYGYEEYINKTDTEWRCLMNNVNYKE